MLTSITSVRSVLQVGVTWLISGIFQNVALGIIMLFWLVFIQLMGQDPANVDHIDTDGDNYDDTGGFYQALDDPDTPRRCYCPWFWFYLPKIAFLFVYLAISVTSNFIVLYPRSNTNVKLPVPKKWPVFSDPNLLLSNVLDYASGI